MALVTDVTERRRTEEALARKGEELQRMNTELEEFAYIAAHDLKSPLRAVANLALVIDEDAAAGLDEENRGRLRMLRQRVKSMDDLINGLLSYAQLGRAGRRVEPVNLSELLDGLVATMSLPQGFRVEWDARPLPTLVADPQELRQIFQNLIGNAATHHNRPEQGRVRVSARDGGNHWCLEVADDGPGIPAHMRERTFRMFSSTKAGHTGIGLAVVRKLVVGAGGSIEVADNPCGGTLFRILYPKDCSVNTVVGQGDSVF